MILSTDGIFTSRLTFGMAQSTSHVSAGYHELHCALLQRLQTRALSCQGVLEYVRHLSRVSGW